MRAFDFSPLYRSTIGFDRMMNALDRMAQAQPADNWPPYNIEKTGEDAYRVTMAVAGFSPDEIQITAQPNLLTVMGQKANRDGGEAQYLHRGIAHRSFKQIFQLADHVKATAASLENGLLTIDLVREVPEAMKPRRIEVESGVGVGQDNQPKAKQPKTIEHEEKAA